MANLIDNTYFDGPLAIGQIHTPEVQAAVALFIDTYESECLRIVLGGPFYEAFLTGIAASDPRWVALRDGATYVVNGQTFTWSGLANAAKKADSIPAHYIFCKYLDHIEAPLAGVGAVVPEAENAKRVSSINRNVKMWNRMIELTSWLYHYLRYAPDVLTPTDYLYPDFVMTDTVRLGYKNTFNI